MKCHMQGGGGGGGGKQTPNFIYIAAIADSVTIQGRNGGAVIVQKNVASVLSKSQKANRLLEMTGKATENKTQNMFAPMHNVIAAVSQLLYIIWCLPPKGCKRSRKGMRKDGWISKKLLPQAVMSETVR